MGFQVDVVLPSGIEPAREAAKHFEQLGYHGLYTAETTNDPLMDLAFPALETTTPMLSNNLVIAFARSPYSVASSAWNLQHASKGRFALGLGTQVKGHITRRFGMTWDSPGPRGTGTIRGNRVESTYRSTTPSEGRCSGTVSADGTQIRSTCVDSVCGSFPAATVRQ